jgi:hypothetical protein
MLECCVAMATRLDRGECRRVDLVNCSMKKSRRDKAGGLIR